MLNLYDFELILFDLDGVLIDSMEAWFFAFNETLESFRGDEVNREEFRDEFWGREMSVNLERLGLGSESIVFCKGKFEEYIELIEVFPGVEEVLGLIEEKSGLVTSTPRSSTIKILENFGLKTYFDFLVSGDDVENPKPSPEPVEKACKKADVNPGNTVFIGDNDSDVVAGKRAGCKVIGVGVKGDEKISEPKNLMRFLK